MTNLLSLYGITAQNAAQFGLTGSNAVQFFGEEAVEAYVQEAISAVNGAAATLNFGGNAGTFFDSMVDAFDFSQTQVSSGNANDGTALFNQLLGQMLSAWQDAENTLTDATGATFDDINWSLDANGNITVSVDGVSSTTVNINDLLAQAGAQSGVDTSFAESFF